MGQDDSCGICGKNYQSCKHFRKSHLKHPEDSLRTVCGRHAPDCVIEDPFEWLKDEGFSNFDHFNKCLTCDKHAGGVGIDINNPHYGDVINEEAGELESPSVSLL